MIEVYIYTPSADADETPYEKWESGLSKSAQAIIFNRISRIRLGNLGDMKPIKGGPSGLYELRIHEGPGYRIYFGKDGKDIVILLCGGVKKSQVRDIAKAEKYWKDYKESKRLRKKDVSYD